MARTTKKGKPTRAGKAKPQRALPKTKPVRGRKVARKSVPKRAKKAAPKRGARKAARPAGRNPRIAEVRQRVARRRPGMAPRVDPAQQDPSIVTPPPPPMPPVDHLHQNWGDSREKSVTRNDKPTNWFRQAPKPPSK